MYLPDVGIDCKFRIAHLGGEYVDRALEQEEALVVQLAHDLFFLGLREIFEGLAYAALDLRERVSDDLVDVLREGFAHRLGEARARLFGGLDARAAHFHAQQPFDKLLRRHGFFEVVVDAEEADYFIVFVADEDAAAFDELAAVVLREVVEYALAALIFLRLEHEQAEVGHRAALAASRDIAVLAEHERALRYRNVVKVHLVILAEYLRKAADDRYQDS